jgi:hypothetical protein
MPATIAGTLAGLGERAAEAVAAFYEHVTGQPYWTGRDATAEFGPTPGQRYHRELNTLRPGQLDDLIASLTPAQLHTYLAELQRGNDRSQARAEREEQLRQLDTAIGRALSRR